MQDKIIFLFANGPVVRYGNNYYTELKNFIDFIAELAKLHDNYRMVVPCKIFTRYPGERFIPIPLPDNVIEVPYHGGYYQNIVSFLNAFRIRPYVINALTEGHRVIFAGPGPYSFLFWLSLILPKSVRFAFFIRGDTLKTVQHIYKRNLFYPIATGLIRMFYWRIQYILAKEKAQIFLFGSKLRDKYKGSESTIHVITPLLDQSFVRNDRRPNIPERCQLKILYVGRLSVEKNIISLVNACILATKAKRPFILSIVGFGSLETQIRNRISDSSLCGQIKLLEYIPHGDMLINEYDKHNLLCLPSSTEGIPRTVIEAFARAMPVLATPVGSLPDLFPEEIKFLNAVKVKDILEGIEWCDYHRTELSSMGREGQKKINRFLISENAKRVDKILRFSW